MDTRGIGSYGEKPPHSSAVYAKTAVHRFAIERGHSVITESVIDKAMEAIMPQRASEKLTRVAKEIAEQKVLEAGAVQTYICGECGYAAHNQQPP